MENSIFLGLIMLILICQRSYGQGGKDYMITDLPGQGTPPPIYSGESSLKSDLLDQESSFLNFTDTNSEDMKSTNVFDKQMSLSTESFDQDTTSANYSDKHPSFRECKAILLEEGDYILFDNGTVHIEAYNQSYNTSFYYLHANGNLLICSMPDKLGQNSTDDDVGTNIRSHLVFYYLTRICLSISMVCLLIHLIVFCIIPDLRNLPGCCMASLCISLLLFYAMFMISDIKQVESLKVSCKIVATLSYFFILSAFMWMATMSFDVFRSLLKATGKLRLSSTRFAMRRYAYYSVFSWGLPLIFVAAASVMDNVEGLIPKDYRPQFAEIGCWFGSRIALLILFGGPVFAIIGINILFFISSAYIIYVNRLKTEETAYRTIVRKNFTLHYRLATIMGLTWLLGVANSSSSFWLLSLYVLFSSLQGFFIFLACTCTSKVRRRLKEMLKMRDRKISTISTTATFQSYCTQDFLSGREIYTITKSNGYLNQV